MTQDIYFFKDKTIKVDCENGFEIFEGSLEDLLLIEKIV